MLHFLSRQSVQAIVVGLAALALLLGPHSDRPFDIVKTWQAARLARHWQVIKPPPPQGGRVRERSDAYRH